MPKKTTVSKSKSPTKKTSAKSKTSFAKKTGRSKKKVSPKESASATKKKTPSKSRSSSTKPQTKVTSTKSQPRVVPTDQGPYSFDRFVAAINNNFSVILVVVLFMLFGFFLGSIWTENQLLKDGPARPPAAPGQPTAVDPTQPTAPSGPSQETLATMPEITPDDHQQGATNPAVTLVVYTDFECPFCTNFHGTMTDVLAEYGDQVAWVYRHFPLSFHAQAQAAAEASECVADIYGEAAFWQYANGLFEVTEAGAFSADTMAEVATQLGYDGQAVQDCVDSGQMAAKVQADFDGGSQAGVGGTPGTIIVTADGQYDFISGALPLETVKQQLEQYL